MNKPSLISPGKPCEFCYVSHTPTECPTLGRGKVARMMAQVKMPTAPAYVPSAVVAWNDKGKFSVKRPSIPRKRVREDWQLAFHALRVEPHATAEASSVIYGWFESEMLYSVASDLSGGTIYKDGTACITEIRIDGVTVDNLVRSVNQTPRTMSRLPILRLGQKISFLVHNNSDEPIDWHGGLFGKMSDEDPRR